MSDVDVGKCFAGKNSQIGLIISGAFGRREDGQTASSQKRKIHEEIIAHIASLLGCA